MTLRWTNRAMITLAALVFVLGLSVAPAAAAKGGSGSAHEPKTEAVEQQSQEAEQEDAVECEAASDSTTGTDATAPCPEAPAAPEEKAPVNLSGKGKAAEHNPNVDAQGNLVPGTITDLNRLVKTRLKQMQYVPGLIDGYFAGTGLSPP